MMKRVQTLAIAAMLATGLGAGHATAQDVMVVYDASGSMWGQIDGVTKIEIAREVLGDLVNQWSPETNLGLVAYGHRREGDCGDIETVIAPQPISPASFADAVNAINPLGRTPLSAAVEHAAEELVYLENPATVVLISDGIENCEADPCALATHLKERGIAFTTHVIGFDVASEEYAQLSCIAENTGGVFVPASNASELADALNAVKQVIEEAPEPQPQPEPEPEVAPVDIKAPASTAVGTDFVVAWSPTLDALDYLTIVPVGADEGESLDYEYAREDTEVTLTAPDEPGLYEVRYVFAATEETAGSAPIEIVDAAVTLAGPETVTVGADFEVAWSPTLNALDWITIVPVGADEGESLDYEYAREDTEVTLTAPAEPGLYELRYVLAEGERTMGSSPVEVVAVEQSVSAPASVATGADFQVSWGETVNALDWITIVPVGAPEGEALDYEYTRSDESVTLTAPSEPGLYEVRYVLAEGEVTMASTPVEVTAIEQSVSAPQVVIAEADFEVTWGETVNGLDWVTIVPTGAEEGAYLDYDYVRGDDTITLTAPAEPGLYEVRYVLGEGEATLASTPVEVLPIGSPIDSGAGLSAPPSAAPGAAVVVTWTADVDGARVTLARADQADFAWIEAQPASGEKATKFTMPDDPGTYEIRFLDVTNQTLLGRWPITVE